MDLQESLESILQFISANITQDQSLKAKKFIEEQSNHIVQISWNIWVKFDTFLPSVLVPMLIRVALKQKQDLMKMPKTESQLMQWYWCIWEKCGQVDVHLTN